LSTLFNKKLTDLVTQAEAARLRGVSRQAISKLVQQGKLTVYEVADRALLSRSEVLAYQTGRPGRPKKDRGKKASTRK
jgi:excisionase family DNA binding protein